MIILVFLICFLASLIGAVCGIGGGVIIKPVLDATGLMDVETISFLSGCTVLSMSTYSVVYSKKSDDSKFEPKTGLPLALGAATGGIVGKRIFHIIILWYSDSALIALIQAGCLLLVTSGTLIYTIKKDRIKTMKIRSYTGCFIIGWFLGMVSSFLGIGGGPINLILLFHFFSMDTKTAAENSLYIIWLSQISSLLLSVMTNHIPNFSVNMLVLMICGGVFGSITGRFINKKLSERLVNCLFINVMVLIIFINLINILKYL